MQSLTNTLLAPFFHARFARDLDLRGDESVLEFGCGGGAMSSYLARELPHGHLTALDTSEAWLERARRRCGACDNVAYVSDDLRQPEVAQGPFDVAIVHLVLHDISADQRPAIVQGLADRLADDGRLHIKEPTKESHGMPAEEIDGLATTAGLRKVSQERGSSIFTGPLYYGVYTR